MLARALVVEPDLLVLDEPTNHMDVAIIEWLEEQLKQFNGSIVFISHDRAFTAERPRASMSWIAGHLYNWNGDLGAGLNTAINALAAESTANALFDKRLAEEKWIRKGIEARRTHQRGRVCALKEMRKERRARRSYKAVPI